MLTNVLILLVVVTIIAVVVNTVGSSKGGVPDTIVREKKDPTTLETSERMEENSLGTLSDRAVAAHQYQMLKDSFEKNTAYQDVPEKVKSTFNKMAKQLATIGTNVDPEDVNRLPNQYLPPGWGLEGD